MASRLLRFSAAHLLAKGGSVPGEQVPLHDIFIAGTLEQIDVLDRVVLAPVEVPLVIGHVLELQASAQGGAIPPYRSLCP